MASKARFQARSGSVTKGVTGSNSKGAVGVGAPNRGGATSKLQVFLNGKIVTPQSLLTGSRSVSKKMSGHSKGESKSSGVGAEKQLIDSTLSHSHDENGGPRQRRATQVPPRRHNQKQVEEFVTVEVEETETTFIFGLTSLTAANDTRDVGVTEERNKRYEDLKKAHENPDGYTPRESQTLNNPQKNEFCLYQQPS